MSALHLQDQELLTARKTLIKKFYQELDQGNYDEVIKYFAPKGKIHSPIYGILDPTSFYKKLAEDFKAATLSIQNILLDESNPNLIAVYSTLSWTGKTGKTGQMDVVNMFEFDKTQIQALKIIYDTHFIRQQFET